MKNILYLCFASILLSTAFTIKDGENSILGRWELNSIFDHQAFSFLIVFRPTGKYDGFLNKKAFVSGTYEMKHDTLYIADPICNIDYKGTYRVEFFAQDSLKFHLIQDTCIGRKEGLSELTYKKVKISAPK